jgi:hypothetical protein
MGAHLGPYTTAHVLGVTPATLRRWRSGHVGPRWHWHWSGSRGMYVICYRTADIRKWLDSPSGRAFAGRQTRRRRYAEPGPRRRDQTRRGHPER